MTERQGRAGVLGSVCRQSRAAFNRGLSDPVSCDTMACLALEDIQQHLNYPERLRRCELPGSVRLVSLNVIHSATESAAGAERIES